MGQQKIRFSEQIDTPGVDASLGGDSVAAGGEELGDDGGLEPLLNKTESCSEAGTSSSNDDGIVLMVDDWVLS